METIQELEAIFSIFHDGYVEGIMINGSNICLKIGIQYLAELIQKEFAFIFLELKEVKSLTYDPWGDDFVVIENWNAIFDLGLEILSVEIDPQKRLLVQTNCEPVPSTPFEGGTLILECSDYRLFDEALKTLTIKKLKELSLDYWTKKE